MLHLKLLCRKTSEKIHASLDDDEQTVLFEADFSAISIMSNTGAFLMPAIGHLTLGRMRKQLFETGHEYWLDLSTSESKFPLEMSDKLSV